MSTDEEKNLKVRLDAWREVRKYCAEHDLRIKETVSDLIIQAIEQKRLLTDRQDGNEDEKTQTMN